MGIFRVVAVAAGGVHKNVTARVTLRRSRGGSRGNAIAASGKADGTQMARNLTELGFNGPRKAKR